MFVSEEFPEVNEETLRGSGVRNDHLIITSPFSAGYGVD